MTNDKYHAINTCQQDGVNSVSLYSIKYILYCKYNEIEFTVEMTALGHYYA